MGGRLAMLGIPARPAEVDWSRIILKALNIRGVYGREMFSTWRKMLGLLEAGLDVSGLITHRIDARDFAIGFETALSGRSGKVVMNWDAFGARTKSDFAAIAPSGSWLHGLSVALVGRAASYPVKVARGISAPGGAASKLTAMFGIKERIEARSVCALLRQPRATDAKERTVASSGACVCSGKIKTIDPMPR